MIYPGIKRAIILALLTYSIFFMVPIILGLLAVIALELMGIYHLEQSLSEQMILIGGLVLLLGIFTALWKSLVLSRKKLVRLLKREGLYIVEFTSKYLIAEWEGVRVCIEFDRPFINYNPVPRTRITRENGKQVVEWKGSFDPRYMYRISRMRIDVPRSSEVASRPELGRRLEFVLPQGVLGSISEDQDAITVVLKWGSWLGSSVIGLVRTVVETAIGPESVRTHN
ncbi:MAG TPA: hypothetical protein VFA48_15040 [Gammaproteobacteria bacterium]|nr:hypothetical protein [Gammaproteobacteria bacterium]